MKNEHRLTTVDHINLVIPGILNLPADEFDAESLARNTPALHDIVRFGKHLPGHSQCFDDVLRELLDYDQAIGLPYASALPNSGGSISQVLFKPVFVKADINNAFVYPLIESKDIYLIINDLGVYFKEDFDVDILPDGTGLLRFRKLRRLPENPHYLCVIGQSAAALQGRSGDLAKWNLLLNEIQMFLYQHPLNQRQMQTGQPFFNSLWIWGQGEKDEQERSAIEWISSDPVMQHLGAYLGCATENCSHHPSTRVIVDLSLIQALKGGVSKSIDDLLVTMEAEVFAPQSHLYRKSLTLFDGSGSSISIRPHDYWKFWKKARLPTATFE